MRRLVVALVATSALSFAAQAADMPVESAQGDRSRADVQLDRLLRRRERRRSLG